MIKRKNKKKDVVDNQFLILLSLFFILTIIIHLINLKFMKVIKFFHYP